MKEIKKILKIFERKGIGYCILRNYKNMEKDNEIDLLVNDKKTIKKIMTNLDFQKGADYGPYVSYKRKIYLDFKVGCLAYQGFCFEKAEKLLKNKKSYSYFFILCEKDELVHLILHSILDKGYFKKEYIKRIEELFGKVEQDEILLELKQKFGIFGEKLFLLIKNKKYEKAIALKNKLLFKLFSFRGLLSFMIIKMMRFVRN